MLGLIKKILGRDYSPLNEIRISRKNLLSNYKILSKINSKVKVVPILKSNAYGHGLVLTARALDGVGAPFFGVDSIYEAYELLKAKVQTPILVMGFIDPKNLRVKKLPFSYAVFDLKVVEAINKFQSGAGVHIFVDTGMNREGVRLEELEDFLKRAKEFEDIKIEGLMSHLGCADDKKDSLNRLQIENFKKAIEICHKNGIRPKYIHLANSDGLINFGSELGFTNLARTGIGLFGTRGDDRSLGLKPALSFNSKVVQVKVLKKGERVGYGGTFVASKEMRVAVLPLGYNDGLDRRLSGKGVVIIDGVECSILGRVSMNITSIDVSKIRNIDGLMEKYVLIYSEKVEDKNSVVSSAKLCGTIPYDLLVGLTTSTRRVLV